MIKIDTIEIDAHRIKTTCRVYSLWKQLNEALRTLSTRGCNIPSEISENIVCYCLGYKLNKGSGGDAISQDGKIIEIKCCSVDGENDLTSFSPREKFDNLIFCKLDKKDDCLYIWDTQFDSDKLKKLQVNKTQKVEDQQKQGRRPHLSLFQTIIKPNNLQPVCVFDIINQEKIKL